MSAPPVRGVLETAVYVDDLERAHDFYGGVLGLDRALETPRMATYAVAPAQVLLVFKRGATREDMTASTGGVIPGHHSEGHTHFAFAIAVDQLEPWRAHLEASGVTIRSEVTWPPGGRSLYFDDPDGNVVELATPGLWPNY
jgi:catechol 2,3-dioxygenase-like lactoylglutathione lyase family enzyme